MSVNDFLRSVLRYILPTSCLGCGDVSRQSICTNCQTSISNYIRVRRHTIQSIDDVVTVFDYAGLIKKILHHSKFGGAKDALTALAASSKWDILGAEFLNYDVVIPIPGSRDREQHRGFSISHEIARSLLVGHPRLASKIRPWVNRRRLTRPLFGLSYSARVREVHGAFEVGGGISSQSLSVVLVDDILTTGSTASAIAEMLRKNGVVRVGLLALARTEL